MSIKYVCDICGKESDVPINDVYVDEHKPSREPLTFNVCDQCKEKKLLQGVKRFKVRMIVQLPREEKTGKKAKHS